MPLYTGVNGTNRLVRTLYEGVNGVNRSIGRVYQGVNGVNRQIFSSNLLVTQGITAVIPLQIPSGGPLINYNIVQQGPGYLIRTVESQNITTFDVIATANQYNITRFNTVRFTIVPAQQIFNDVQVNIEFIVTNQLTAAGIITNNLYSLPFQFTIPAGTTQAMTYEMNISSASVTGHLVLSQPYLGQGTVQLHVTDFRLI